MVKKTTEKCRVSFLLLFLAVTFGISGCDPYYGAAYPAYGPYYGPRYATYPGYGYGPYRGGVAVEIGDRPYYTRGAGYYAGRYYYVWRPGHWGWRGGQKVWIHGHYVVR